MHGQVQGVEAVPAEQKGLRTEQMPLYACGRGGFANVIEMRDGDTLADYMRNNSDALVMLYGLYKPSEATEFPKSPGGCCVVS
jgi:hypothetical protein